MPPIWVTILTSAVVGAVASKVIDAVSRWLLQRKAEQRSQKLIDVLWEQIEGKVQTPAEIQLQKGLERAQKAALSHVASDRGVSPGLAQRQALEVQTSMSMEANQQAAQLRSQERERAIQLLSDLIVKISRV